MMDETPTMAEMIELLKLYCPCGEDGCDGVWLTRSEAEVLIRWLECDAFSE